MDTRTKSLLAITIGVIISLLAVHVGEPTHLVVWGMLGVLVLWSLRFPVAGLLAALPMVYMIQPTPTVLGWQEIGFALVLCVSGFSALIQERELFLEGLKHSRWMIVGIIFWVAVNLLTALWHGVPLVDWLRGVAPFVFLLYLVPVCLILRSDPSISSLLQTAILVFAVLFSLASIASIRQ